ncbi:MAG TPA: hypothetical protein VGU66_13640 [Candidatus Elarobacter sp.]|nr:hypothetical protein [Candidatus Elarobacter sp.]
MNDPDKKLPTLPENHPSGGPTVRATTTMFEVDGGAFLLLLSDLRPVAPYAHDQRFEGNSGYVEVGRFVLSPMAFVNLKNQMAESEAYYESHFGPLPDVPALMKRFYDETPERRTESAQRMGFRPEEK